MRDARSLRQAGRDAGVLAGYRVGWAAARRLPEAAAYRLFDRIADTMVRADTPAVRQLRANYAQVRPDLTGGSLDALVAEGARRVVRYYGEAFRLPALSADDLASRVRVAGDAPVRRVLDDGGSVICFLGHLGNWDLAGAWATVHLAPVTTVAERLRPESVYAEFLRFRTGLGMTILPLTGGAPPLPALQEATRRRGLIPLLADRDLTRRGIEVRLCGRLTRMAAGPATLALTQHRPLHPVSIRHERRADGAGWGIVITFHPAVSVPRHGATRGTVTAMTQACADALSETVTAHTADWHMMQRTFLPEDP